MATTTFRSSRKSVVSTGVEASSIVFLSGRVLTWRWIFEAKPGKRTGGWVPHRGVSGSACCHGYEQFNSIVTFNPVVMRSSLAKLAENSPCSNR